MSCNDGLQASNLPYSQPILLILGAAKRIALNIYQKSDDVDNCGGCGTGSIVIPPTVTVVSATVNIYLNPDAETPILTDTATITNILDDDLVLIGYKITYMINTTVPPLDEIGEYMLVLSYTTDTGEIYPVIMYFNIVRQAFVGNC